MSVPLPKHFNYLGSVWGSQFRGSVVSQSLSNFKTESEFGPRCLKSVWFNTLVLFFPRFKALSCCAGFDRKPKAVISFCNHEICHKQLLIKINERSDLLISEVASCMQRGSAILSGSWMWEMTLRIAHGVLKMCRCEIDWEICQYKVNGSSHNFPKWHYWPGLEAKPGLVSHHLTFH